MNRGLLQVLFGLLLLVVTSTPAAALCRPENRVGVFSEKPSVFASQEVAKPIGTPSETPACGYDFASGVHKYLYCKGNPVNKVDPSGHDGIDDILTIADAIGTFGASVSSPSIGRVTGTGGPDVTKALNRTLLDVQAKFWSWNRAQKIAAAERMRDLWGAATSREANGARAGAADAWDIFPLMEVGFDINYGYLIANGQSYRAGTGFWTRTVAFSGKCYYASAVNYALWGTMNRCVSDWLDFDPQAGLDRDEYSLGVAVHIMQAFKHFSYHDFGPIEKEAADFTAYGFNGTPPSWALPCKPSGVVAAKMFDWCWEPVVPRNPGARR